jgi:hypothetical protein
MADNKGSDKFESEEDVGQREQGAKHCADGNEEEEDEDQEVEEEEDEEEDALPPVLKKKGQNLPRDWKEVKRWQRADYWDDEIDIFVSKELDDFNRFACIMAFPCAHKNRNNKYCYFQYSRQWESNNGASWLPR